MSRIPPTFIAPTGALEDLDARSGVGRERRIALQLPGLGCRACARRAEDVLRRVPGVLAATVRLFSERADVRFDTRRTSEGEVVAAVGRAGFTVAGVEGDPAGGRCGVEVGVALAVLVNLMFLERAGLGDGRVGVARAVLALIALAVAGGPPARRAVGLARRGILDRDALAGAAAILCFAAGVLELALVHGALVPPAFLASLGASAAAWPGPCGVGFESAAAIAVSVRVARALEAGLLRFARRDLDARERRRAAPVRRLDGSGAPHAAAIRELGAGNRVRLAEGEQAPADLELEAPARVAPVSEGGTLHSEAKLAGSVVRGGAVLLSGEVTGRVVAAWHDPEAALDAEVGTALARLAARVEPAPDTWEDAATRGVLTAALGFAVFALVTHGWLGAGPLGPLALFSAAAVLAAVSPSAIAVATPAAHAVAILRARALGVLVRDVGALLALAGVNTVCFARSGPLTRDGAALRRLRSRGIRALALGEDTPAGKAAAIRDLQLAGARVALVGDGGDDGAALAQADVAVTVAPGPARGPIVLAQGRLDHLAELVDESRALRSAIHGILALAAVANAILIPAAAVGWLTPLRAATLVLAETLLGLTAAATLLGPRPS